MAVVQSARWSREVTSLGVIVAAFS
jgi:hypothetical protein